MQYTFQKSSDFKLCDFHNRFEYLSADICPTGYYPTLTGRTVGLKGAGQNP